MAFTKINAAGIGTTETVTVDGLTVINDGSFGGNLTVGGVLTYEDVTNVDSIGIITARAGVLVGSGITLSKDGEIFATGISTIGVINSDKISLGDSEYIHIGIGSDLKIQHDSNNSIISNSTGELLIDSPIHNFRDTSNTSKAYIASNGKIKLGSGGAPVGAASVEIRYADPVLLLRDTASTSAVSDAKIGFGNESHYPVAFMSHVWDGTNGALTFHTRLSGSESEKLRITSTGNVIIGGTSPLTDAQLTLSADDAPLLAFQRTGSSKFESAIGMNGSSAMRFYTGADSSTVAGLTEAMNIAADGVITAQKSATFGNTSDSFTALTITSSTSGISELRLGDTTANAGYIKYSHSTNLLEFATNQTPRMQIESNGQVTFKGGEGSTDAIAVESEGGGQALLLANFRGITDTGDTGRLGVGKNNNILIFTNASGSQVDNFAIGNTDSIPLILSTANTKRMVISGGGDIGINVGNPGSRLAIYDADGDNLLLASHNYSGETRIGFTGNTGTGGTNVDGATTGAIGVTGSAPGGAATGHMSVYTNYGDSLQERLRLTAAGQAFFNSGKNTNFSAMAANHKGNFSSFESTTGVDSNLASGVIHHAVVYRATGSRTDNLFSFKGSGNCGFFCEVTAYFAAATVGTYQGRQRMWFRASRNSNNNFQVTQAHNYDKVGTNTTTFFNPLWGSSSSGANQVLTVQVQTTSMTNYIGIMYVTRFISMDSIHTFTTLL